jgi:hypothetical protein
VTGGLDPRLIEAPCEAGRIVDGIASNKTQSGNNLPLKSVLADVMQVYSQLADTVVVLHAAYVGLVILGLLAILLGSVFRWRWVRNFWFRIIHLAMIGVVAAEAICGVTCPLTILEQHWRKLAGESIEPGSFVGRLAHQLLFYDAPPWVFDTLHIGFAILVLLTFICLPPDAPWKKKA